VGNHVAAVWADYPTAVSQLNERTSPRRAPVSSSKRNGNFRFNLN